MKKCPFCAGKLKIVAKALSEEFNLYACEDKNFYVPTEQKRRKKCDFIGYLKIKGGGENGENRQNGARDTENLRNPSV